jgi:hypothetical protein
MQGPIAQCLGLAISGNARIQGADPWAPDEKLFQFDEFVRFVDLEPVGDELREHPFAGSWADWYDRLLAGGVAGFRVHAQARNDPMAPDRMLVAFVGGGPRWLIETVSPGGSDFWQGRTAIGDRDAQDKRIWRVTYGRIAKGQAHEAPPVPGLEEVAGRMRSVLEAIKAFADGQAYLSGFSECFARAISDLDGEDSPAPYYALGPEGFLSPLARRTLSACEHAWVFGGMGSWNDIGFDARDERDRYEAVSQALFQVINEAMAAAANSTFAEPRALKPALTSPGKRPWWRPW